MQKRACATHLQYAGITYTLNIILKFFKASFTFLSHAFSFKKIGDNLNVNRDVKSSNKRKIFCFIGANKILDHSGSSEVDFSSVF